MSSYFLFYYYYWSILSDPSMKVQISLQVNSKLAWQVVMQGDFEIARKGIRYPQQYKNVDLFNSQQLTVYRVSRELQSKTVGITEILHSTGANNSSSLG